MKYATFRYDTVEVENGLYNISLLHKQNHLIKYMKISVLSE